LVVVARALEILEKECFDKMKGLHGRIWNQSPSAQTIRILQSLQGGPGAPPPKALASASHGLRGQAEPAARRISSSIYERFLFLSPNGIELRALCQALYHLSHALSALVIFQIGSGTLNQGSPETTVLLSLFSHNWNHRCALLHPTCFLRWVSNHDSPIFSSHLSRLTGLYHYAWLNESS
jgi:hypothetical protein